MIFIGADHGGFELKEKLKVWLIENSIAGEDLGAFSFNADDDYPDFIIPVAKKVALNSKDLGIIIGRSGNGEAMAANKIPGIRAAVCLNEEMARKAREHNNANILSLGADYISFNQAKRIIKVFLETPFSNKLRYKRRLQKLQEIEENN